MPSIVSPLQLTAAASLLANTGFRGFPSTLKTAIDTFNATTVIGKFIAAVNYCSSIECVDRYYSNSPLQ